MLRRHILSSRGRVWEGGRAYVTEGENATCVCVYARCHCAPMMLSCRHTAIVLVYIVEGRADSVCACRLRHTAHCAVAAVTVVRGVLTLAVSSL